MTIPEAQTEIIDIILNLETGPYKELVNESLVAEAVASLRTAHTYLTVAQEG